MLKYKYFAQPINNLGTNRTILYELLLRQWDERQQTWRIPATFEIAPTELIQLLDCAIQELNNHHVSINLTARQFANPDFQVAISHYVQTHLLPRELTVELVATPELSELQQLSVGYRAAGILLAFDDVGSDNLFQQIKMMLPYVNTVKFALQNMRPLGPQLRMQLFRRSNFGLIRRRNSKCYLPLKALNQRLMFNWLII
ncbi:hypothetical protein TUA1478L_03510 [Lactiplantibacillus plantarum]